MAKKIVESTVPWRGSLTDLATDVAYLMTPEEGREFIRELQRFLTFPHLADKWQGKGHAEDSSKKVVLTPPKKTIKLTPPRQPTIDHDSFMEYMCAELPEDEEELKTYLYVCKRLGLDPSVKTSWKEVQTALDGLVAVYNELSERLASDLLTLRKNFRGGAHATVDQTTTPAEDRTANPERSVGHAGKPDVSDPWAGGGGEVGYVLRRLMKALGRSPEQTPNQHLIALVTHTVDIGCDWTPESKAEYLIGLEPEITKALSLKEVTEAFTREV